MEAIRNPSHDPDIPLAMEVEAGRLALWAWSTQTTAVEQNQALDPAGSDDNVIEATNCKG